MSRYDKLVIIFYVAVVFIVYVVNSITFEMLTYKALFRHGTVVFIVSLLITAYFCLKHYGFRKIKTYGTILIVSVFLWFSALVTAHKLRLLFAAAFDVKTETAIKINEVSKVFHKSSFDHTAVNVTYHHNQITFETSCTNFFALEHRRAIRVIIGKAGAEDYYVTKVFWQRGEKSRARSMYWHFWIKRNWIIPVVILAFAAFIFIVIKLKNPRTAYYNAPVKYVKPQPAWKIILKIAGIAFGVVLLLYLLLITYVFIRYGGCKYCKFW